MKYIIISAVLAVLTFMMSACTKNEGAQIIEPQTEVIMLRVESVSSDSSLTYSPVIAVQVKR